MEAVSELFDFSRFMPHGMCFLWRWDLLILHVGADLLIALAYFSIPAAILVLMTKRPEAPRGVPMLFVAFIMLCGITHVASIVVIWYPAYVIEGLFKLATAIVSVTTAVVLWPLIPRILAMPSRNELEQRNLEIQQLNRRLQQRIDSLSTLAGGVSHDFNNLLTVIRGYAQILQDSRQHDPEALASIMEASDRAADVCRQMLAYSGRGHFMLVAVDLNEIVSRVELPKDNRYDLTYSLSNNIENINASGSQVEQLVNDLCMNAIEAIRDSTREKGEVVIKTYRTTLTKEELDKAAFEHEIPPGDVIVLQVSDNGVGMSPQVAERIFEPYFSTKFTGRGLGLAAVQGIVRGHRGCLIMQSEEGKGTKFRIVFPIEPATTIQYRTPIREQVSFVLVVDDEPEILSLAKNYLTRLGCKVLTTTDPDEAIRLTRKHRDELDAVIVDYLMPHTTGSELLRQLFDIIHVDAYITSGYSRGEIDDPTMRRLLTGFIAKPFEFTDFAQLFARPD